MLLQRESVPVTNNFYRGNTMPLSYPFETVSTCPIYIIPNFGTINWDKVTEDTVKQNIKRIETGPHEKHHNEQVMMYIHVPFCTSFCLYCNFARDKFPWQDELVLERYVDYLIKEIDFYLDRLAYSKRKKMCALYIGGGSPSTLGAKNVERLVGHLARKIPNFSDIEKTFTGEPKTLKNKDLLTVLNTFKFDRITFGIETTDSKTKKMIGRTDKEQDLISVFENLDVLNFKGDTCVDMMYNFPGQSLLDFEKDLKSIVEDFSPTEIDAYNLVYLPYRPLHKLILKGKFPQPANMIELLKMREFVYDYLLDSGYHNTISETYSKHSHVSEYQKAHCARHDIMGVGVAARGNLNDFVSINPATTKQWMKNIDVFKGPSTQTLQDIGKDGVFYRIMTMWPRYKELDKNLLETYSDVKSYNKLMKIFERHKRLNIVDEKDDKYIINKLGVIWHPNMQLDYMSINMNLWGKVLFKHFTEKKKTWDRKLRYKTTYITRFMDYFTEKYPKLMK